MEEEQNNENTHNNQQSDGANETLDTPSGSMPTMNASQMIVQPMGGVAGSSSTGTNFVCIKMLPSKQIV